MSYKRKGDDKDFEAATKPFSFVRFFVCFVNFAVFRTFHSISFVFGVQFSVDCKHSLGTVPRPANMFIRASERVLFSTDSHSRVLP